MADWNALIETAKTEAEKLGEKTMSFVMRNAAGEELAAGFVGSDQNKKAAICKGNDVLVDGSDARLANPAVSYGKCLGMCCVFCGCCWCDCLCCKWSIAQSFCTGKLRLLGAVPVQMPDGTIGTFACAGSQDCQKDKDTAVNTLIANGYAANAQGVFVKGGAPSTVDAERV